MPTIATATVIGHLYGPAELKQSDRGPWCRIRFWTSDKLKGQEEKKFTSWGGLVSGPQAEWMARDAKKGSLVFVSGTVRLDSFTKQDGTVSHSIEFTRINEARILDRDESERQAPSVAATATATTGGGADDGEPPFAPESINWL